MNVCYFFSKGSMFWSVGPMLLWIFSLLYKLAPGRRGIHNKCSIACSSAGILFRILYIYRMQWPFSSKTCTP